MKHEIFKSEDFQSLGWTDSGWQEAADIANKKLNELIESWPVAYGDKDAPNPIWSNRTGTTHKSRLAFIEGIIKEPCKHKPVEYYDEDGCKVFNPMCEACGVSLQATWSEKK